jgi:hypothetical protein
MVMSMSEVVEELEMGKWRLGKDLQNVHERPKEKPEDTNCKVF